MERWLSIRRRYEAYMHDREASIENAIDLSEENAVMIGEIVGAGSILNIVIAIVCYKRRITLPTL